jgi:hypothetical protein
VGQVGRLRGLSSARQVLSQLPVAGAGGGLLAALAVAQSEPQAVQLYHHADAGYVSLVLPARVAMRAGEPQGKSALHKEAGECV